MSMKLTNRITRTQGHAVTDYDHAHKVSGRARDWSRQGNRGRKDRNYSDTPAWARRLFS